MNTIVKWGLLLGLTKIVWSLIAVAAGLEFSSWWQWAFVPIAFGFYYLGLKEYRDKDKNGLLAFNDGVVNSLKIGAIEAVIYSIYNLVYTQIINPNFAERVMENSRSEMLKSNPNMTDEQVEQALSMAQMFTTPGVMFIFIIVGGIVGAVILGLIASALLKKDDDQAEVV